jgi:VWFA-related protein
MTPTRTLRLGAAAALAAAATLVAGAQQQVIDVAVDVIKVPVTVLDGRNRFVAGLKQVDFELLEDHVPQQTTYFALEESGIAAELLLDVSGSMTSRIDEVKRAAIQFVRQMTARDVAKILQFDEKVTPLSDFSADRPTLEAAIMKAKVGGATAMYNALWTALADLQARRATDETEQRHRAVIVLTDGDDTASAIVPDEVMSRARSVDAIIYSLDLDRQAGRPVTDGASAVFLRELASQTGGNLYFPEVSDLQKLYRQLGDELRKQYVLGYVSSNTSGKTRFRSITVRVKNRKELKLRHRLGYFPLGPRQSQ